MFLSWWMKSLPKLPKIYGLSRLNIQNTYENGRGRIKSSRWAKIKRLHLLLKMSFIIRELWEELRRAFQRKISKMKIHSVSLVSTSWSKLFIIFLFYYNKHWHKSTIIWDRWPHASFKTFCVKGKNNFFAL